MTLNEKFANYELSSNFFFLLLHNSTKWLICLPVVSRQHIFPHMPPIWEWPGILSAKLGEWVWQNNSLGKSHSPYPHCFYPPAIHWRSFQWPRKQLEDMVTQNIRHSPDPTEENGAIAMLYLHTRLASGSGSCLLS